MTQVLLPAPIRNRFLIDTERNYKKYRDLTVFTHDVLLAKVSDPAYKPIYNFFKPLHDAYITKYNDFEASSDTQGGTLAVSLKFDELGHKLIDRWDRKVQDVFEKGTPGYKNLFPNGHYGYHHGSENDKLAEVNKLITKIGTNADLAGVKGEAEVFVAEVTHLMQTKGADFDNKKTDSHEVELARVDGAKGMFKVLSDLNSLHYLDPEQTLPFFDWERLHPGDQKVFVMTLKPGETKFIVKRTLQALEKIKVANEKDAAIELGCVAHKGDASGTGPITIAGSGDLTVTAEEIHNSKDHSFFVARNTDTVREAHFRMTFSVVVPL